MARRNKSEQPQPANLTSTKMKDAIPALKRRITELQVIDVDASRARGVFGGSNFRGTWNRPEASRAALDPQLRGAFARPTVVVGNGFRGRAHGERGWGGSENVGRPMDGGDSGWFALRALRAHDIDYGRWTRGPDPCTGLALSSGACKKNWEKKNEGSSISPKDVQQMPHPSPSRRSPRDL